MMSSLLFLLACVVVIWDLFDDSKAFARQRLLLALAIVWMASL